jgi:hypothetical protein
MSYTYADSTPRIRGNGTAIVALITGLIGIILTVVTGWIPIVGFFLILLPSVLAIIFGAVGKSQAKAGAPHGAKAAAGLACGLVAILLTVLMQLCWGVAIGGVVISGADRPELAPPEAVAEDIGIAIDQRIQAEWERMKALYPEIEIEIVDDSPISVEAEPGESSPVDTESTPGQNDKNRLETRGPESDPLDNEAGEPIII